MKRASLDLPKAPQCAHIRLQDDGTRIECPNPSELGRQGYLCKTHASLMDSLQPVFLKRTNAEEDLKDRMQIEVNNTDRDDIGLCYADWVHLSHLFKTNVIEDYTEDYDEY